MLFQQQKNVVGGLYSTREKRLMNENDEQINELFSENKEMIIFTIAKQFKQPTLACKNKKITISFYLCTFRKLSKTNTNLLIDAKQEWFFSA